VVTEGAVESGSVALSRGRVVGMHGTALSSVAMGRPSATAEEGEHGEHAPVGSLRVRELVVEQDGAGGPDSA
jgi:hypothetical protein